MLARRVAKPFLLLSPPDHWHMFPHSERVVWVFRQETNAFALVPFAFNGLSWIFTVYPSTLALLTFHTHGAE